MNTEISTFQASAIGNFKFIDIAFFILTNYQTFYSLYGLFRRCLVPVGSHVYLSTM